MIRRVFPSLVSRLLLPALFVTGLSGVALAQEDAPTTPKPKAGTAKPAAKPAPGKTAAPASATKPAAGKAGAATATAAKPAAAGAAAKPGGKPVAGAAQPVQLAVFGDWGAYASDTAKGKVCYALARPKERLPKSLKRDDGYLFISNRPAEGVRNEVSVVLGFQAKDGSEGSAVIGSTSFALVTKGDAAWVKNAAEDAAFVDTLRKGQSLVLKATSKKGNESTDRYALNGFVQALDRVKKECP
jgi:hypothetical protein